MNSKDLKKLNSVISEIPHVKDRLSSEASPSMKEELLVKLQGLYATVIFLDPIFALECKYEVEVWNEVFRNSISTLQNAVSSIVDRLIQILTQNYKCLSVNHIILIRF